MTQKSMVAMPTNEDKTEFGRPKVIATEALPRELAKGFIEVGTDPKTGQLVPKVSIDVDETAPLDDEARANIAAAAIVEKANAEAAPEDAPAEEEGDG